MTETDMRSQQAIHYAATSSTLTLYWDLPAEATAETSYEIMANGEVAAHTNVTHYSMEDLPAETTYEITVTMEGALLGTCTAATTAVLERIDVTTCGVVGDGTTMNTASLQAAINACNGSQELYFPAGTYLTGALTLHSHMAMYLDAGAILQGSAEPADYEPRIWSRFEGTERECYQSLLNLGSLDHTAGPNCSDILIYGKGTISGGGIPLFETTIERESARLAEYLAQNQELVATCENTRTIPGRVRGRLISMCNCERIRLSGLRLENGASWNIHMIYSRDILTDHCTIASTGIWNGDGWDPDSSENCTLFATHFETEDDSVAIKSGKNPEGNEINRPCRHIRVFDCDSAYGHGICIGSEMSGGVEDVAIWGCDIGVSSSGIEIKGTSKRGGYVRNVSVRDCTFPRLQVHAVPYNNDGVPAPTVPRFEDCTFERLTLTGRCLVLDGVVLNHDAFEEVPHILLEGFDAPNGEIENVRIKDCVLLGDTARIRMTHCRNVVIEDLQTRG